MLRTDIYADFSGMLSGAVTQNVILYVAENVTSHSDANETVRSVTPQRVLLHMVEHASSLKLIKDKRFNTRAWLIPLAVIATIVIVGFLIYNKLRQLLLADFSNLLVNAFNNEKN